MKNIIYIMILLSYNMKAQINTETISADLGDGLIPINAVEQIPLPESCKDVAKKISNRLFNGND